MNTWRPEFEKNMHPGHGVHFRIYTAKVLKIGTKSFSFIEMCGNIVVRNAVTGKE